MRRTFLFLFIIVLTGSSFTTTTAHAASTDIVINEIGAAEGSDHEWIEIYNTGTASIDMTGWKLFEDTTNHGLTAFRGDMIIDPGEYAVIADVATNTANDYPNFTGTLIDSSWTTLTETGEQIALKDTTGAIIEQFTYVKAPTHSLERIDATLADYTDANWKEHPSGNTTGAINSVTPPPTSNPPPPVVDLPPIIEPPIVIPPIVIPSPVSNPSSAPVSFNRGDVVLNEFVSDPSDDGIEWIELYNPFAKNIDLAGWTIEDGSKTKTILTGTIGSSANNRFFIIENPKGKLNNAGDLILLKDVIGNTIDEISFGNWDDGNTQNNAPAPTDPFSSARTKDGINTFNNAFDFHITTTPTKGSSNVMIDPGAPANDTAPFIKDISISELLPDPIGPDTKSEFIELYNKGNVDINLLGWEIVNAAGRKYIVDTKKLNDTIIKSKGYFILDRSITGIALKNTGGDNIKVYQPNGEKPNATLVYKEKTTQGQSYAAFNDQTTGWTTTPTPGQENIRTMANQPPDPDLEVPSSGTILEELTFDASDTTDPEQDLLTYTWDFGDGQKGNGIQLSHHYEKAGRYKISLVVKDTMNEKKVTKTIVIDDTEQSSLPDSMTKLPSSDMLQSVAGLSPIVINEISPNPKGKDTNEFIELANISNNPIDLAGWRVMYQLGKKSFTFPDSSTIDAAGFRLLTPANEKIELRNAADTITLYNPQGDFMDIISYEDAPEAQSLMRTQEGDFVWSILVTPGKPNNSSMIPDAQIIAGLQTPLPRVLGTSIKKTSSKAKTSTTTNAIQTTLENIRDLPLNTAVMVQGVVASIPGVLGANIFYLAGSGIQVYVSKAHIPHLNVGDRITLIGTMSQISDESRIKVAQESDIHIISHGTPPVPHLIQAGQVSEEYEGNLVTIKGEVVKVQWPSIYVDDGTDEARVYIKTTTGIKKIKIEKGSTLQVTGVVSQTTSGYRVLPRTNDDLIITSPVVQNTSSSSTPNSTTLDLGSSDKPVPLMQIGVVSLFGIIFLGSSMYIQRKTNKK